MDKTFDTGFKFYKRTIIGDVGDPAFHFCANREFAFDISPWIRQQLFHAKRNTLGFGVKADHLNFDCFTNLQGFRRMADALPGNVGDVQQAVNAAKVNKRAIIGDVFHHALQHLTFLQVRHQLGAGFGAGFFQNRTAGYHNVTPAAVNFQNLERLRCAH